MENEKYYLNENSFAIPFKDDQDLIRQLQNSSSQQLIEKQKELNLILDDDAILLLFISHQGKYIDICYLQHQIIDCKLRVNNTLYNEDIIVNEIKQNSISLPSKSCYNVYLLQDDSFLIQCQGSINQFKYYIVNYQSEIVDEIIMDLPQNCRFDSKFQFNKLIINSMDCEISIVLIVQIISKDQKQQFNKTITKLHELNNFPIQSNLIDLKICESNKILLGFVNLMSLFNFQDQSFTIQYYSQCLWFQYFQGKCFPYVIKGVLSTYSQIEKLSVTFDKMINLRSQIKSIQIFDSLCIFLYEDQVIVMQDYAFEQSIQNVKQIFKLHTLPFLITLNNNNQITFYKIISYNRFIHYQHFPFVAIFFKTQIKLMNNIINYYHLTSQYSINYPMEIPIRETIKISQYKVINNFKIDTNVLFESIPFYLDIEFDQDSIQVEYKNQIIITHHRKLPIKQILKVISIEMNFVVIIYENWNKKIVANIKNDNYEQNIQMIPKTHDLSVEFTFLHSDIIIYLISSESIMNFMIVDKKDLLFINSIKTKNKIKECKYDLINIICHLTDNTIYKYQFNYFYEYYSTKHNYELRDFWISNQEIKYNDFRVPYLYINHEDSTISMKPLIPYQNDIIVSIDGQIILSHIFVLNERILLIVKKDNQILLWLYFFEVNQIILLYKMPTYEFQIQLPIKIKFYGKLFGIITIQNEQEYLFIYDVTQQGRHCLRQITKLLPNMNSIELMDETGIFIQILTDQIVISYPTLFINIKSIKSSDYVLIDSQIKFQIKSYIQSIPFSSIVLVHVFNSVYNLRYKQHVEQQKLIINNQNEITNLDLIFGSINNLQLGNQCQGSLIEPIKIVSNIQLHQCWQINQRFCLISQNMLIYDFFNLNRTITLPHNKIFLNNIILSNHGILIIYNTQNHLMGFFNLSQNSSFEDNFTYIQLQRIDQYVIGNHLISINLINNYVIVLTQQFCQTYQFDGLENPLECHLHIQQIKQIQFLHKYDFSLIFLFLDANSELSFHSCILIANYVNQNIEFKQDLKIAAFHILNSKINNQEIKVNVILFCHRDLAYIFEFTFDFKQFILIKQSNQQFLRYPNITFENFQRVSDTIYILKGSSQNSISSYYLYKINQNLSDQIIDYFYKYNQNQEIQIYNETHFIQIQRDDQKTIIQLLEINYYKMHLKKNCDLILHNDVSTLNSTIELEENIRSHFTLTLVFVNFLLILIIIKKNKAARNKRI